MLVTVTGKDLSLPATVSLQVGVQGPPGPAGSSSFHVQHDQISAAAAWTINHNLGKRPNVSVFTVGGAEVWAEILHISADQLQIHFDVPFAGFAILS